MFRVTLTERISTSTKKRSFQTLNLGGFLRNLFAQSELHGLQQHKLRCFKILLLEDKTLARVKKWDKS